MHRSATTSMTAAVLATIAASLVAGCHRGPQREPNAVGTTTLTSSTSGTSSTSTTRSPLTTVGDEEPDRTTVVVTSPEGTRHEVAIRAGAAGQDGLDTDPTESLSRALCERQLVCNAIHEGGRFATLEACLAEARRHATARLVDLGCSIDDAAFSSCTAEVRAERCSADVDVTSRAKGCRHDAVCRR